MKIDDQDFFPGMGATNTPSAVRKALSVRFSELLKLKLNMSVVLIFVAIAASPAFAATYYVDFSNGNNSNTGVSSSTPWKHSPGDPNATASAARTVLPGDTVIFKGGVQYDGRINVNGSGTSSNRIRFLSGDRANPVWGSGRGIIDGGLIRQFGFYINGRSWIDIEGLEIQNIGAPTRNAAAINYENAGGVADNNRVRYCKIHNVNWSSPYVIGYGIENNHGSFHTYEYNEVYNCTDKLIETYGGATTEAVRGAADAHHNIMRFNVLHNSAVHGVVFSGSDNEQFYSNIIYSINDGAISASSGLAPNPGFALKVDQGSRNQIYNNIIYTTNAGLGVLVGDDNKLYSNTIYGIGNGGGGFHGGAQEAALVLIDDGTAQSWLAPRVMRNEFVNNIVYYMTGGTGQFSPMFVYMQDDRGSGNKFLNNHFSKASNDTVSTAQRIRHRIGGVYAYSNVTDWEANFNSWEGGTNNVASGNTVSDPLFLGGALGAVANLPTGFIGQSPDKNGLTLSPASPAGRAGFVLGAPFDEDIISLPRVAFSRGAYELTSPSPLPPRNLRIEP